MVCDPVAGSTVTSAKLSVPDLRIFRAGFELQPDRRLVSRNLAGERLLAQAEQVGARLLDVDIDRVEPLDRGQRIVLPCLNQSAGRIDRPSDAPGDRSPDHRPLQVDLGGAQRGGLGGDVGARLTCGGLGIFI